MSANEVRYGPRPPEARVDHEIDATKAPIATEAVTVTYLTDPDIVAAVLPKPLEPAAEPWCESRCSGCRSTAGHPSDRRCSR